MKARNNDPKEIVARFNSRCAETGREIKKGERCIYYPASREVFHPDSKQAEEFWIYHFDINVLGGNY